jgi:hypothetical protein
MEEEGGDANRHDGRGSRILLSFYKAYHWKDKGY